MKRHWLYLFSGLVFTTSMFFIGLGVAMWLGGILGWIFSGLWGMMIGFYVIAPVDRWMRKE